MDSPIEILLALLATGFALILGSCVFIFSSMLISDLTDKEKDKCLLTLGRDQNPKGVKFLAALFIAIVLISTASYFSITLVGRSFSLFAKAFS